MNNWRQPAATASRAYLRYFPLNQGKQRLWSTVVEPRWAWLDHPFTGRTRFGSVMQGTTRELLQQYVYYFGIWEPQLSAWLTQRLRPGDTFVDIGANVGYFSLLAARCVGPTGTVVAVEPSPRSYALLTRNLARNGASNVRTAQVAVGDQEQDVTLFAGEETHWGLASVVDTAAPTSQVEAVVAMRRLASVLAPSELSTTRVIKIDVEGAEAAVVDGLLELLGAAPADLELVVEIGPDRLAAQGRSAEHLHAALAACGYHAYLLPNAYDVAEHLQPPPPPRLPRLDAVPGYEADVVFSRNDVDWL